MGAVALESDLLWLTDALGQGPTGISPAIRAVLRSKRAIPIWHKAVPFAISTHVHHLLAETEDALAQLPLPRGVVISGAGLGQHQALVPALIGVAERAEAVGDFGVLNDAFRALGRSAGEDARHFLIESASRYLQSDQDSLIREAVRAIARLRHPDCLRTLEAVQERAALVSPETESSLWNRCCSALGLLSLGAPSGSTEIGSLLRGSEWAGVTLLRLLPELAPDASELIPELCGLVARGPKRLASLALDALEAVTGGPHWEPPVTDLNPEKITGLRAQACALLKRAATGAIPQAQFRTAEYLGKCGDTGVRETLLDMLDRDPYRARRALFDSPLAADEAVQKRIGPVENTGGDDDWMNDPGRVELMVIRARGGSEAAQRQCARYLTMAAARRAAVVWDASRERPSPFVHGDMGRYVVIGLAGLHGGALRALEPAIVSESVPVLHALLLTSRRDVRLQCVRALQRSEEREQARWLDAYSRCEPCCLIREEISRPSEDLGRPSRVRAF